MKPNVTPLERAFELARSGRVPSVGEIRRQLKREGYEQDCLVGRAVTSQLRSIIDATRGGKRNPDAAMDGT